MKLEDITVLIPSIGRPSLFRAAESIPEECKIIICYDFKKPLHIKYDNVKIISHNFRSPGLTKQALIDSVETDWFFILDDDDWLSKDPVTNETFLHKAVRDINELEPEYFDMPKWYSTHYKTAESDERFEPLGKRVMHIDRSSFSYVYWDWVDGKRDETYTLSHVYPCTEVLCNTKEFRKTQKEFPSAVYRYKILDDVMPMMTFMSNNCGMLDYGYGILYEPSDNSVSRTALNSKLLSDVKKVIGDASEMYLKTRDRIWLRCITNALRTSDFNFNFNKK